jgi:hypothetical protein
MQLNIVEQELLTTIHNFPLDVQKKVLKYSLSLKKKLNTHLENKRNLNIIDDLIRNPLVIDGDSTPFKREEIYESRKD